VAITSDVDEKQARRVSIVAPALRDLQQPGLFVGLLGKELEGNAFRDRAEMFDEYTVEPERFEENEGQVVALIRVMGRGSASGAGFDIRIGHVSVLRDGVIVRGEGYGDRDRALEAVGVRE
jgi:ketosteroid isomerase-like protein